MTDDRLEKVRKEVEKQLKFINPKDNEYQNGRWTELNHLLLFIDSMQEEPKFKIGQTITDPDDSTFTFHINRIENGKYIESDDAWVLIKDADEEYQLVEESVSDDWKEAYRLWCLSHKDGDTLYCIDAWKAAMDWQKEQFEKNRLKHCNSITNEQAELEQGFIDQHLDKHQRMPTFLDAIEYGMKLMKEQMMKSAVDSCAHILDFKLVVQVCLPFGNKQRIHDCDKVRVIIIKEE